MYPAKDARELAVLLKISRELDIVGDATATVNNPSELLAWALIMERPDVVAWRALDSGHRYLHVTAQRAKAPIRGQVTAVLDGDQHRSFWEAMGLDGLAPGDRRELSADALSSTWATMAIRPADSESAAPRPPAAESQ